MSILRNVSWGVTDISYKWFWRSHSKNHWYFRTFLSVIYRGVFRTLSNIWDEAFRESLLKSFLLYIWQDSDYASQCGNIVNSENYGRLQREWKISNSHPWASNIVSYYLQMTVSQLYCVAIDQFFWIHFFSCLKVPQEISRTPPSSFDKKFLL